MKKPKPLCIICEWRESRANHRCPACNQYLKRNGKDRDWKLIITHSIRILEKRA